MIGNGESNLQRSCARTILLLLICSGAAYGAATVTIVNLDSPGEGFNDPTAATPVGGNAGTTIGQQRLIAFERAAEIWGQTIESTVEIFVEAEFSPLSCNESGATLGQAGANQLFRNFPGAPFASTWYPAALANALAGSDQGPGVADIGAEFNSSIDNNNSCLSGTNWYYGLDHNEGGDIDFLATILHEIGHGLGVANYVNEATGTLFLGTPDIYTTFTLDSSTGEHWDEMTTPERSASAINCDNVVWDGAQVTAAAPSTLNTGVPNLSVNSPAAIAGDYRVGPAPGADLSSDVTAAVQLVNDGAGNTSDGCQSLIGFVAGNIALMDLADPTDCGIVTQLTNALAANPAAFVVADSQAGCPAPALPVFFGPGLPPGVMITQALGNDLKSQLPSPGANATLGIDNARLSGANASGFVQLYATDPVQPGSSISHFDTLAFPNLLMEPAITSSLTDNLDLTPSLLVDIGWTLVGATADLSVMKTDDIDPVVPGGTVDYTVTVNNAGPGSATNVVAADTLPAGVTFVSTTGCAEDPGGVPACDLGTIANGGSEMYTVTATVDGGTLGTITNNVSVSSDAADPSPGNNAAAEDTLVVSNLAPTADSVTPSSGSGPGGVFSYTISDPIGFQDIRWYYVIFNGVWAQADSCYVWYAPLADQLYLRDDASGSWLGPLTPGSPGTLQNFRCSLNAGNSSAVKAGASVTLNLDLQFHQDGPKTTWLRGSDSAFQSSGWVPVGTWTVTGNPNLAPTADSVTPSSGSGPGGVFSYTISDPNGFQDIRWYYVIFNGVWAQADSCYVWCAPLADQLYLRDDASGSWLGPLTPGSPGTLQNFRCSLNAGNSSAVKAGASVTLNLDLQFHQDGPKTTWLRGSDSAFQSSGWVPVGTWTVTGNPNLAPTADSVTPSSGSGPGGVFSYTISDPNGFQDIRWYYVIFNGVWAQADSCYVWYAPLADQLYLRDDVSGSWLGPLTLGAPGTLQNFRCSLNTGNSSAVKAGASVTLNLDLQFDQNGPKTTWLRGSDSAFQSSGWVPVGTWTVTGNP